MGCEEGRGGAWKGDGFGGGVEMEGVVGVCVGHCSGGFGGGQM